MLSDGHVTYPKSHRHFFPNLLKTLTYEMKETGGHTRGSEEALGCWIHSGGAVPKLAIKRGHDEEEQREVEDVRGLHGPQQSIPKDSFPLFRIDQLVDLMSNHELLSFMDVYSGYNQIRMSPENKYTSLMTDQWTYYYKVMPFGFKNVSATYQRLVNKMF
ncbi:hypothetical protein Nepgr_006246 [Nepenthes gracilis]|uniref:Reverse transcriptase domain-containing protein n=1 Tax=Nepenthes gracilis TaxID=150966 RepID=A0AAD3XH64_NEPGR|nr:hypothetical protein Nepgr_006246 [Nepenthes gracilis]